MNAELRAGMKARCRPGASRQPRTCCGVPSLRPSRRRDGRFAGLAPRATEKDDNSSSNNAASSSASPKPAKKSASEEEKLDAFESYYSVR